MKKQKGVTPDRLATCSRCGLHARVAAAGSGGFTRRGCDHGLGTAAARSSPAGLLHPHGQTQILGTPLTLSPEESSWRLKELYLYFTLKCKAFLSRFLPKL